MILVPTKIQRAQVCDSSPHFRSCPSFNFCTLNLHRVLTSESGFDCFLPSYFQVKKRFLTPHWTSIM